MNRLKHRKCKLKNILINHSRFQERKCFKIILEFVSSSVLSKIGFPTHKFYQIQNIGSRFVSLRKFIRGNGPLKFDLKTLGVQNKGIYDVGFYKFFIIDEKKKKSFIYYNEEKLNLIKKEPDSPFFIDSSRKLVSFGVDRRQLFTINTKFKGRGITLVYILSRSQTTDHYYKCFKQIQNKTSIFDKCSFVIVDMEIAFAKALDLMGKILLFYCFFKNDKMKIQT